MIREERDQIKQEIRNQFIQLENRPRESLLHAKEIFEAISKLENGIKTSECLMELAVNNNDKEKSQVLFMALFLWLFEGAYASFVNLYCYLLVANGHKLEDRYGSFAKNLKQIARIGLKRKFRFIKLDILKRENDRVLRNDIAHFNFSIVKGRVIIEGKVVFMHSRVLELLRFTEELIRIFDEEQKSRHK